ncbi:PAS domain S-box protein [Natrononativus amylolyticus]|uniref:PAS domain S-box protein n=1 Tax=Natrononativus amylolyticus TaxID=2963434 RepID=UPI0020CEFFA8|nr:PAS domain S-box protein [Natrononativus amylolyticus]
MKSGSLSPNLRETLDVFDGSGEPLTTLEVAEHLDVGRRSTYARLERLIEEGRLETKKVGASARVWWQPPAYSCPTSASAKRPEQGSPQASDQFEALLYAVEEYAIFTLDAEGTIQTWNAGAERIKGDESEEIIGKHVSTFYTSEDREQGVPEQNLQAAAENGSTEKEGWRVRADGSRFWAMVTITPIRSGTGELEGFVKVTRDMTDRREYERRLERQAARLERQNEALEHELDTVFERITDGFYALDEDLRFEYVNDSAHELLGLHEPSVGADIRDEVLLTEPFEKALYEALESQTPVELEDYYDPAGGWYYNAIYPSESGLSVYFRNITETKRREQELERYVTILDAIGEPAYELDDNGQIVFVNEALAEYSGYEESELLGQHVSMVMGEEAITEVKSRIEALLKDEDKRNAKVEFDLMPKLGGSIPVETRFSLLTDDEGRSRGSAGMVWDISERKEREQNLETQVRMQETIAELGQRALEDVELDRLLADASEAVAGTLDNEYCKVLDLDSESDKLLLRQGVGWDDGLVGTATISAVEANSQAAYTLATEEPVVVEDLATESRFNGPDLLTNHGVTSGISVAIGSPNDPWGILGTHDAESKEFTEHDISFVQSVANILATAVARNAYEQELVYQYESLAALNDLNSIVSDITDRVIEKSTRKEIEQAVCDALAAADAYEFAWVADVDSTSETFEPRTTAGTRGYVDEVTVSLTPNKPGSEGPGAKAIREQETQVVQDVFTDPTVEPFRDAATKYGFSAVASIPIVHEGTVYGVLAVYADRQNAFDSEERDVISQLGEVVGHAIAAAERKQALMSDELIELEFQIRDVFEAFDTSEEVDGTITIDNTIPVANDGFLVYGTATQNALDALTDLVETTAQWESITVRGEEDPIPFELHVTDPPVLSTLDIIGGYVDTAVIEDGDLRMIIHLAPSVEVRRLLDTIEEAYPQSELLRRQQITRSRNDPQRIQRRLLTDLTDQQRTVLTASYHAGFFKWPREATGEEVAESLGVAPATFHQHLRKAERKVFDLLFSDVAV